MGKRGSNLLTDELRRAESRRNELTGLIARTIRQDGAVEPIKDLQLFRVSSPGAPIHSVYKPSLCIVVQGSKEFFLNDERYVYDPANYLIVTAQLPLVGQVMDASRENPYLSLLLELDPALVGSVIAEVGEIAPPLDPDIRAINVSALNSNLLDAVLRLVRLVDKPSEAEFLAPMIIKEIVYRLWMDGEQERLLHLVNSEGNTSLITRAIERINEDFSKQLRVESIASELGMSVSGFHHHFKAVTAMSPLQYQKRLRLQEARRLLLVGDLSATDVAFRVGYNDSSHFSREYKGLFGLPPKQDVERLHGVI